MTAAAHANNGTAVQRDDLWTLYRTAVEEMRFQVNLNWDRTKHYFIFNVGLLSLAGAASSFGRVVQGVLFLLTAVNSLFAAYSIWRGHTYYRSTRGLVKRLERQLEIPPELSLRTTPGMEREAVGQRWRLRNLPTIVNFAIALQVLVAFGGWFAFLRLALRGG